LAFIRAGQETVFLRKQEPRAMSATFLPIDDLIQHHRDRRHNRR